MGYGHPCVGPVQQRQYTVTGEEIGREAAQEQHRLQWGVIQAVLIQWNNTVYGREKGRLLYCPRQQSYVFRGKIE